ncbi:hypothetical protein DLAC_01551 [Tieghemostelium lacteum]|uniref:Uncharacterized protein n=1 Tax=Tieghemostelium lacteum TaxID=361077 RepID=A0A152A5Q9_TIELA|nr:hypothetical protein DLAC_01551 [Tieghemostelium lacteum]|eukprot:KYR01558.1 hypothetical protein DLAC_01551 [Tieghemostelium lacteum]
MNIPVIIIRKIIQFNYNSYLIEKRISFYRYFIGTMSLVSKEWKNSVINRISFNYMEPIDMESYSYILLLLEKGFQFKQIKILQGFSRVNIVNYVNSNYQSVQKIIKLFYYINSNNNNSNSGISDIVVDGNESVLNDENVELMSHLLSNLNRNYLDVEYGEQLKNVTEIVNNQLQYRNIENDSYWSLRQVYPSPLSEILTLVQKYNVQSVLILRASFLNSHEFQFTPVSSLHSLRLYNTLKMKDYSTILEYCTSLTDIGLETDECIDDNSQRVNTMFIDLLVNHPSLTRVSIVTDSIGESEQTIVNYLNSNPRVLDLTYSSHFLRTPANQPILNNTLQKIYDENVRELPYSLWACQSAITNILVDLNDGTLNQSILNYHRNIRHIQTSIRTTEDVEKLSEIIKRQNQLYELTIFDAVLIFDETGENNNQVSDNPNIDYSSLISAMAECNTLKKLCLHDPVENIFNGALQLPNITNWSINMNINAFTTQSLNLIQSNQNIKNISIIIGKNFENLIEVFTVLTQKTTLESIYLGLYSITNDLKEKIKNFFIEYFQQENPFMLPDKLKVVIPSEPWDLWKTYLITISLVSKEWHQLVVNSIKYKSITDVVDLNYLLNLLQRGFRFTEIQFKYFSLDLNNESAYNLATQIVKLHYGRSATSLIPVFSEENSMFLSDIILQMEMNSVTLNSTKCKSDLGKQYTLSESIKKTLEFRDIQDKSDWIIGDNSLPCSLIDSILPCTIFEIYDIVQKYKIKSIFVDITKCKWNHLIEHSSWTPMKTLKEIYIFAGEIQIQNYDTILQYSPSLTRFRMIESTVLNGDNVPDTMFIPSLIHHKSLQKVELSFINVCETMESVVRYLNSNSKVIKLIFCAKLEQPGSCITPIMNSTIEVLNDRFNLPAIYNLYSIWGCISNIKKLEYTPEYSNFVPYIIEYHHNIVYLKVTITDNSDITNITNIINCQEQLLEFYQKRSNFTEPLNCSPLFSAMSQCKTLKQLQILNHYDEIIELSLSLPNIIDLYVNLYDTIPKTTLDVLQKNSKLKIFGAYSGCELMHLDLLKVLLFDKEGGLESLFIHLNIKNIEDYKKLFTEYYQQSNPPYPLILPDKLTFYNNIMKPFQLWHILSNIQN